MQSKQAFFNKNVKETPFAEIIESSLECFIAQSWNWENFPQFASLVQVEDENLIIIGCVTQINTGSMDPSRYPFPYQKTKEELIAEQPQIFEFLKTTFKVQIVGYANKNNKTKIYYLLPQIPCAIHSFVKKTENNIINIFFNNTDYLNLLFSFENQIPNIDELLICLINQLFKNKYFNKTKINKFCKKFSLLTGNDYKRLKLFLGRIENLIQ